MNVASYTNYFRQLAVRHHKLQHDPNSITVESKRFARYSAEEVITGLRAKIAFPAMLLELYESRLKSESAYSVGSNFTGAFSIYATANSDKYETVEAAYDLTEEIMNDMLAQIWQDHYGPNADQCQTPFSLIHFGSIEIMPVGPVFEDQYGWRCEFSFLLNHMPIYTTAPASGVFINP